MFSKEEQVLLEKFKNLRKDFPILNQKIGKNKLVYVDNGATTQKPKILIKSLENFYYRVNSNIHRSAHTLAKKADELFDNSRKIVADFIGAKQQEIVFTSGATDSLNKVAFGLSNLIEKGDEILLTKSEHHANLVPWQEIAKLKGAKLRFIELDRNFKIDLEDLEQKINRKTKVVSIAHISNVLGVVNDVEKIGDIVSKKSNAIYIVDGAQSVPHIKVDVKKINCDFLLFSAHKMCGPTGVGILYGKFDMLKKLKPISFGGSMIYEVFETNSSYQLPPANLEAGTPNIAGIIAFGDVVKYLDSIGLEKIEKQIKLLSRYFIEKISTEEISGFKLLGPKNIDIKSGVFSFVIDGVHSHDIVTILDKKGIAVRGGHHCAMPLHTNLEISSSTRISFYFYNTIDEIDIIISALKNIKSDFEKGYSIL